MDCLVPNCNTVGEKQFNQITTYSKHLTTTAHNLTTRAERAPYLPTLKGSDQPKRAWKKEQSIVGKKDESIGKQRKKSRLSSHHYGSLLLLCGRHLAII